MSENQPCGRTLNATERSKFNRKPDRGSYDLDAIHSVLKEGSICHLGFVDHESPCVIPTIYAPIKDEIVIHGSTSSRMMKLLREGAQACITITVLDGLVLARSTFAHSMNYRSVVIFGKARLISEREEKMDALKQITEHLIPGRWNDARIPNEKELSITEVLAFPLQDASLKMREGSPKDLDADYELDVWAGILPLRTSSGSIVPDQKNKSNLLAPRYLERLSHYEERHK